MKIVHNGVVRELTPEEIEAMEAAAADMPDPEPTIEERITDMEDALIELAEMLVGGEQ